VALEVAYRIVAVTAAFLLIRYRWARWEIGPWLLSLSLLMLHLHWETDQLALARRVRLDGLPAGRAEHAAAGFR